MSEKVEYEKKWCKYEFNSDELKDIAENLAIKTQQLQEVEAEKKAVTSAYNERIQRVQGEIIKSASLYKDRYEMRDIECTVERDFESGEIRYVRTDNYQVASRDKMTMAERQKRIEELLPSERPVPEEKTDEEIRQENETKRLMTSEKSSLN